jgi:hypothetical protein
MSFSDKTCGQKLHAARCELTPAHFLIPCHFFTFVMHFLAHGMIWEAKLAMPPIHKSNYVHPVPVPVPQLTSYLLGVQLFPIPFTGRAFPCRQTHITRKVWACSDPFTKATSYGGGEGRGVFLSKSDNTSCTHPLEYPLPQSWASLLWIDWSTRFDPWPADPAPVVSCASDAILPC